MQVHSVRQKAVFAPTFSGCRSLSHREKTLPRPLVQRQGLATSTPCRGGDQRGSTPLLFACRQSGVPCSTPCCTLVESRARSHARPASAAAAAAEGSRRDEEEKTRALFRPLLFLSQRGRGIGREKEKAKSEKKPKRGGATFSVNIAAVVERASPSLPFPVVFLLPCAPFSLARLPSCSQTPTAITLELLFLREAGCTIFLPKHRGERASVLASQQEHLFSFVRSSSSSPAERREDHVVARPPRGS